jgi:membrane-associated phospholipid phosphatase
MNPVAEAQTPAATTGSTARQNPILRELRDWPVWWAELSPLRKVGPAAIVGLYWVALSALGGLRGDHISMGGGILALAYGGRFLGQSLLPFALPVLLTGIIYDSQRFYSDYLRGPVHVTEPYNFDKRFFGITTPAGVLTPNEWWQLHTYPLLDLITGFMYLVFIAFFVVLAAYFRFVLSRTGSKKTSAAELAARVPGMMWAFLVLNLVGYSTYYWYAAAPPWYVAKYGLGPARMDTPASQAGCVRFDQLLGTHFFSEMYGRAADVFGAIPSLHVAYPMLAVVYALRFGRLRAFCVCFYLLMCFSAVYLNHHYILDIIWGSSYAVLIGWAMDAAYRRRYRRRLSAS